MEIHIGWLVAACCVAFFFGCIVGTKVHIDHVQDQVDSGVLATKTGVYILQDFKP